MLQWNWNGDYAVYGDEYLSRIWVFERFWTFRGSREGLNDGKPKTIAILSEYDTKSLPRNCKPCKCFCYTKEFKVDKDTVLWILTIDLEKFVLDLCHGL